MLKISKRKWDQLLDAAKEVYPEQKILRNLAIVQAIHESRLFHPTRQASTLARKYNNFFGIKGKGTNGSVSLKTWEVENGKRVDKKQDFAVHADIVDSFRWHAKLMHWRRYKSVRKAKTFSEAAHAVRKSGYATDPAYSKKLIQIYDWLVDRGYLD